MQTSWICFRGSLPRLVFYPEEGGETSYIFYGVVFPASFFGQGEGRQTPCASQQNMVLFSRNVYLMAL